MAKFENSFVERIYSKTQLYMIILGQGVLFAELFHTITPGHKIFWTLIGIIVFSAICNFAIYHFLIPGSRTLAATLSFMVNFPAIMTYIWVTGGISSILWVLIPCYVIVFATAFKTEIVFLMTAGFSFGLITMTFLQTNGNFGFGIGYNMVLKIAAIIIIGIFTKSVVNEMQVGLDTELKNSKEKHEKSQILLSNIIKTLYSALETKDVNIRNHSHRVIEYSLQTAEALSLSEEEKEKIRLAALLHDIGKMKISDMILKKSEKLTQAEYEVVKRHPIDAMNILEPIDDFQNILIYIKYHHERWDGKGYPEGLKGETIPLLARILAVANSFDAMTTDRIYQKRMSKDDAIAELKKHRGSQFDPKVVDAFVRAAEDERKVRR